jgi:hypothetical protein
MSGHTLGLIWLDRNQAKARALSANSLPATDLRHRINSIRKQKEESKNES